MGVCAQVPEEFGDQRPSCWWAEDLNGAGEEFLRFVRGKTRRLGYRVSNAGMNGHGHGHAYVVGGAGGEPSLLGLPRG